MDSGTKVSQLQSVISKKDINQSAHRLLLLAVIWPTLEYGSEVWETNKTQDAALESLMLGGAKHTFCCTFRTHNEAVRVDMRLDSSQGCRDKVKFKWWYKLACVL